MNLLHLVSALLILAFTTVAGEIPPPPSAQGVASAWLALQNSAELQKKPKPPAVLKSPCWDEAGYIRVPALFTTSNWMSHMIKLNFNLQQTSAIEFDFFCLDFAAFGSFSLRLYSDTGNYDINFDPDKTTAWQRIRLNKANSLPSGQVKGWSCIRGIAIIGRKNKEVDTLCAIANLRLIQAEPEVVILRGDSSVAEHEYSNTQIRNYSKIIAVDLTKCGLDPLFASDYDLTPELLQSCKIVVLPHNPHLSDANITLLRNFTAQGGKLLVCRSLTKDLGQLLGLQRVRSQQAPQQRFAGMLRAFPSPDPSLLTNLTCAAMDGQPEFAPQCSRYTTIVQAANTTQTARVVAVWSDHERKPTAYPAVTLVEHGAFIGDYWFGEFGALAPLQLLSSLINNLVPDIWQSKHATHALQQIGKISKSNSLEELVQAAAKQKPTPAATKLLKEAEAEYQRALTLQQKGQWQASTITACGAGLKAQSAWFRLQPDKTDKFRAFWLHPYLLPEPDWDTAIKYIKDHGFNAVIPLMLSGTTAMYPSDLLHPHPLYLEKGDQVALCLQACRKYGVECHVWKTCRSIPHDTPQEFVDQLRTEGRLVKFSDSKKERNLCPSHPANQDLEVNSLIELVKRYAVDGIHFDYIRYPSSFTSCFCDGCRARFEAQLGHALNEWPRDVEKDGEIRDAWLDFRCASIDTVVERINRDARLARAGIKISAAVFSNPSVRDSMGQDWPKWCQKQWLDMLLPMNYTDSNYRFSTLVELQHALAGKVTLYPGMGVSSSGCSYMENGVKIAEQINIVREQGLDGFVVFPYGSHAKTILPFLFSDK